MLRWTSTHPRESGFTLIELVVSLFVGSIILALLFQTLGSTVSASRSVGVNRETGHQVASILERFERDTRGAGSPARLNSVLVRDQLRTMLIWGLTHRNDNSSAMVQINRNAPCTAKPVERTWDYCQYEDVTQATQTRFWFRSDVDASVPGAECVQWNVVGGELWRVVTRDATKCWPGNTGAVLTSDLMLDVPPNSQLGNAQGRAATFSYLMQYNRTASALAPGSQFDMTDCVTVPNPVNVDINDFHRAFITNVTLDLAAFEKGSRNSTSRAILKSSATIVSRANDDYAYAAGCAL